MAIWQVYCNIIPNRKNEAHLNHDELISWRDITNTFSELDFLERENSWSKDIIQYGKLDETCIEFIYTDVLEEISCRFDLRSLTKEKFNLIIEYVRKNNAMFLFADKLYSPDFNTIKEVLVHSKAYEYTKNPIEYLESISENVK